MEVIIVKALPQNQGPNTLSVAQKIKVLRKVKKMNQSQLADIIMTDQAKISRIESEGGDKYNQKELEAIKEHFGIADMPLTEDERAAFRERLYYWRDLIRDLKMSDAEEMHKKISAATLIEPFDPDMAILYRLYEVLLLLTENSVKANKENLDAAEEKLKYLEGIFDKMNT